MKSIILFAFAIILLMGISCNGQQAQKQEAKVTSAKGGPVEVIYFHTTSRCVTCTAVENVARNYILEQYAAQIRENKLSFISYNIEQPEGKAVALRIGITSQSLMIVRGQDKHNIINEGFMYAVNRPERFREIIKTKIDPLLK